MKANELMLGDWVKTEAGELIVAGIGQKIYCRDDSGNPTHIWEVTTIEPIPLTKEILEKNGFDFERHAFREDEHYALEIYIDDGVRWTINCYEYDILLLEYVHQLQHALKLCGIEKEIKL